MLESPSHLQVTDASVADATALPGLLDQVPNRVKRLTADGGHDRREVYEAARKRGATTVIPSRRDAVVWNEPVLSDRNAHIECIGEVGRRRWRLEAGQHHQSRAENTFYRYKRRFGGRLSARNEEAQRTEVLTACNILNKMSELGMPCAVALRGRGAHFALGRVEAPSCINTSIVSNTRPSDSNSISP